MREAGFKPIELRIVARGTLERDDTYFRVTGWSEALPIEGPAEEFREALEQGHVVRAKVEGWAVGRELSLLAVGS